MIFRICSHIILSNLQSFPAAKSKMIKENDKEAKKKKKTSKIITKDKYFLFLI